MGVQGKKKRLVTFLEVVVVSGYPCCVKQVFEQELTLVVWRFPRELHCLELYRGRKGPVERISLWLPCQRLEPVGGLLSLSAASPVAAAPHLQCLRDPPLLPLFTSGLGVTWWPSKGGDRWGESRAEIALNLWVAGRTTSGVREVDVFCG